MLKDMLALQDRAGSRKWEVVDYATGHVYIAHRWPMRSLRVTAILTVIVKRVTRNGFVDCAIEGY